MRRAVDALVTPDYLWMWLKRYTGSEQVDFDAETAGLVETVRLRAAFEHEGRQNRGLHVHILIEIGHRTMVQVSKWGLCEVFRRLVGENPNCHCRFVKGSGEDKDFILRYITKEIPAYRPDSQLNSKLAYAFRAGEVMEVESK